ncbi:hypothetical protein [Streptomyces sasae]|uniref:hypothetical protein n=1 Tax=Streptomyces sasae TaxID=1266772 RepID=UPI00292FC0C6|nr:hypothetical protein [Streptomyces sasae]
MAEEQTATPPGQLQAISPPGSRQSSWTGDDMDALLLGRGSHLVLLRGRLLQGWVTRQVELHGSELAPIVAASPEEWQGAQQAGDLAEYEKKYGVTAELPVSQWENYEPDQLTSQEFEEVWDAARREITAR